MLSCELGGIDVFQCNMAFPFTLIVLTGDFVVVPTIGLNIVVGHTVCLFSLVVWVQEASSSSLVLLVIFSLM